MRSAAQAWAQDLLFVVKLAGVSLVCASVIKFGSLASDVAFTPLGATAAAFILSPPLVIAVWQARTAASSADNEGDL